MTVASLVVAVAVAQAAATFDFVTTADRTDHVETGRLSEVQVVCDRLRTAKQGCEVIGTSPEGRPIHAYRLSSKTKSKSKPTVLTVLIIGSIHAGEVDGKDATFAVVKRLINGDLKTVLDHINVVFVPVYNVDGHERFGPNHRPNQRGPKEMGWRTTSQNLNLNRDWTKADAPETRAMLKLIERIDPVVIMDLHATDGAKFQHDIAVLTEPWHDDGTDTPLIAPAAALTNALVSDLRAAGHLPLTFYPSFEKDDDPTSGFAAGVVPARLTHGYAARRGRIGVLIETHSWRPYKERVQSTVTVVASLLRHAATHAAALHTAAKESDALRAALPGKGIALTFDAEPKATKTIDFLGYAYTREKSDVSGGMWTRYDENTKQVWKVPLIEGVKATHTVTAPSSYVVLPGFAEQTSAVLLAHGVRFSVTKVPTAMQAQRYVVSKASFRDKPYEGRHKVDVEGDWQQTSTVTVPKGALIVPVAQVRGRLVVELMEPRAYESFVGWGFMNARFEQKEYMEDYVAEEFARELLKDPSVRAAFEVAKKDTAFANDPAARLDFFYRRHPAYDSDFNVVPILRIP